MPSNPLFDESAFDGSGSSEPCSSDLRSGHPRSVRGIRLAELFPSATRTSLDPVAFTSCVSDWREVQPGDVFVALPDTGAGSEDGHLHAQRAVSHGAIAVVCEQPVPVFDVPTYLVPDSRVALGEISQALMGYPCRSMQVIGVTGTHGKSTTLALLESIFAAAGKHCGKLSSLGCYDGMSHSTGMSDLPTAPALASRLARMEAAGCTHALVEISSQALSQARLAGMELAAVGVTQVTDAHLDCHNTLASYRQTKRQVLKYLSPEGVTVLSADDPVSLKWLDEVTGPVLTCGLAAPAEVTATVIESHANEQTFVITAGSESMAVRTAMIGEHHVSNCLTAATVALSQGIDLQSIAAGLESVEQLPARMERVACGQGFPLFLDAANTPGSLRASLRTARQLAERRVICVWSDATGEAEIRQVLNHWADLAIVTESFSQGEDQSVYVEVVDNRSEAIACAVAIAEPGDVVVVAGSQPAPEFVFGSSEGPLADGELVRQLLATREQTGFGLVA